MKTSRIYLLVIVALLGTVVLLRRSGAEDYGSTTGQTRVAVCDVVQVFNNYVRANDLTAKLTEQTEAIKGEDEKRRKAIETLEMELEGLLKGSKEYQQRYNEMYRQRINRQAWLKYEEDMARSEHHRLTSEMYVEVRKMIAQVARQTGYQIVLYFKRGEMESGSTTELRQQIELRKVLYADASVDLTDTVLMRLNETYRASQE